MSEKKGPEKKEECVQVIVRVRPLSGTEQNDGRIKSVCC